ncbi:MAG: hypothetical protein IRY97_12495, partial [Thermomicrobiaceae bacterium]|nr:hypothetical protein [Thermomicrobiaceae bacterium]
LLDGVLGFALHVRGIRRLPGGFRLGQYNVVMGPPIFAPLLMCTVGLAGGLASLLRPERADLPLVPRPEVPPLRAGRAERLRWDIAHGRFQQGMALVSALFAVLAGGEAYFEHLRGSFNRRVMWTPVWVTPPMIAAGVGAARSERVARQVLPLAATVTFVDGLVGFLLHLQGIKRMPGHFTNLRFNLTYGPPLFAPLLFCAVGLLGLIASLLRRERRPR